MFYAKRWQKLAGMLKEQAEPAAGERKIVSYYETWSPEDVEIGDTDKRGELDEWVCELDEVDLEDGLTHSDKAAKYLLDKGALEPSSSFFHQGIWYSTYDDEDFRTGDRTVKSYHLKGFTEDEEREIWAAITQK